MELTCLNCAGTFEVPDDDSEARERTVQCPMCGQEQRFAVHEESPFATPRTAEAGRPVQTQRISPSESDGSGFRKPMQAFSSFARRKVIAPGALVDDTSSMRKVKRRQKEDTSPDGQIPKVHKVPSGTIGAVEHEGDNGSTTWLVKSPTGLVLEFPSSHLLVNWSAIVDKPGPYSVSKGGDVWQGLGEFLEEVRQGDRGTAAFRRLAKESVGGTTTGSSSVTRIERPAETPGAGFQSVGQKSGEDGSGDDVQADQMPVTSPTSQFQFKIRESREDKGRKWVVLAVIGGGLLLLAGGVAALFLTGVI